MWYMFVDISHFCGVLANLHSDFATPFLAGLLLSSTENLKCRTPHALRYAKGKHKCCGPLLPDCKGIWDIHQHLFFHYLEPFMAQVMPAGPFTCLI